MSSRQQQKVTQLNIDGSNCLAQYDHNRKLKNTRLHDEIISDRRGCSWRLPPVCPAQRMIYRVPNGNSSKWWAYGTSVLVKLMFGGNLPTEAFDKCAYGVPEKHSNYFKDRFIKHNVPNKREPLWTPKKQTKKTARSIDKDVRYARDRHRKSLDIVSEKQAHHGERRESVILKRSETMADGLVAFLDKMQRRSSTGSCPKWQPPKLKKRRASMPEKITEQPAIEEKAPQIAELPEQLSRVSGMSRQDSRFSERSGQVSRMSELSGQFSRMSVISTQNSHISEMTDQTSGTYGSRTDGSSYDDYEDGEATSACSDSEYET